MSDTFGEVIRSIRKQRKMTQKMLCEDICSQSVLSRIEVGEELPNVLVMQQLCERLGVSIDQVMHNNSSVIQKNTEMFDLFADLFLHKQYSELVRILHESNIIEHLYLEREFQLYYYYLGNCEYFLHHNLEKSLSFFKKGLYYTSKLGYLNATNEEVRLISCVGRIYAEMDKQEEAEFYLKKSFELLNSIPRERVGITLTKVYYNYAYYMFRLGMLDEAEPIIDLGVQLARQKNSYYFLDDLFHLKSLLCQARNDLERCEHYRHLAEKVKNVAETK